MWHRPSYRRLDCGTNIISREPAADSWRWTISTCKLKTASSSPSSVRAVAVRPPLSTCATACSSRPQERSSSTASRSAAPAPIVAWCFRIPVSMPWRTVFKNVIFGLECQSLDNGEGSERARKFIKLVGLQGFEDHYPHELSGGMQQRCNLARALTVDPKILDHG